MKKLLTFKKWGGIGGERNYCAGLTRMPLTNPRASFFFFCFNFIHLILALD
ncbi:hypothetical protein HanRHA438_Chr14g0681151 [Helianthus annuus]|nr:hypothetical protein HanRHA438_Chr14g0681151 [Helianthus annuus]